MIFNLDFGGGKMTADKLHFGGSKLFAAAGSAWEAALLSSGTLTVQRTVTVDLWIVAGGMPGSCGSGDAIGGQGGSGGECKLISGVRLRRGVTYTVTIGQSGEDTSIVGSDGSSYSAASGQGSAGGVGAKVTGLNRDRAAHAGADGVFAYNETMDTAMITQLGGRRYGASGGGGEAFNSSYVHSFSSSYGGSNAGGETGAGIGGTSSVPASDGAANTGAGGGGAYHHYRSGGTPGAGGSGILMFRSCKEALT